MSSNDADRIARERAQRADQEARTAARDKLLSLAQQLETEIPITLKALAEHDYPGIETVTIVTPREVPAPRTGLLGSLFGGSSGTQTEYVPEEKGFWWIDPWRDDGSARLLSDGRIYIRNIFETHRSNLSMQNELAPNKIVDWAERQANGNYLSMSARIATEQLEEWLKRVRGLRASS